MKIIKYALLTLLITLSTAYSNEAKADKLYFATEAQAIAFCNDNPELNCIIVEYVFRTPYIGLNWVATTYVSNSTCPDDEPKTCCPKPNGDCG